MKEYLFYKANMLYETINRLIANGIDYDRDLSGAYEEYNELIEENDFSSVIFTGSNGLKGVKWGYGRVMIPSEYDEILYMPTCGIPYSAAFAIAKLGCETFLVNYLGHRVFKADEMRPCETISRYVFFNKGGKWGIITVEGIILYEAQFDDIRPGSNGFIFLWRDGKEGFIDPWGNLFEPKFERIDIDGDDNIVVTLDGQKVYLNENGEFVTDKDMAHYNYNMIF